VTYPTDDWDEWDHQQEEDERRQHEEDEEEDERRRQQDEDDEWYELQRQLDEDEERQRQEDEEDEEQRQQDEDHYDESLRASAGGYGPRPLPSARDANRSALAAVMLLCRGAGVSGGGYDAPTDGWTRGRRARSHSADAGRAHLERDRSAPRGRDRCCGGRRRRGPARRRSWRGLR
jgi:hypothetical protein